MTPTMPIDDDDRYVAMPSKGCTYVLSPMRGAGEEAHRETVCQCLGKGHGAKAEWIARLLNEESRKTEEARRAEEAQAK